MAKFGTIHNWLDYDSIRMAGVTKEMANIVGKSIGAASVLGGEVVDQAFRNYETKEEKTAKKNKEIIDNVNATLKDSEEKWEEEDYKAALEYANEEAKRLGGLEQFDKEVDFGKYTDDTENQGLGFDPLGGIKEVKPSDGNNKNSIWDKAYDSLNAVNAYPTVDGKYTPAKGWLGSLGFTNKTVQRKAKLGTVGRIAEQFKGIEKNEDKIRFLASLPKDELKYFSDTLYPQFSHYKTSNLSDMISKYIESGAGEIKLASQIKGMGASKTLEGFDELVKKIDELDANTKTLGENPGTKPPTNRLNLADSPSKTPFPRLSPLGRYKETPLNQMQDMLEYGTISEASMPDYLGSIGKAAEQGYNRAIQKFNYNLKVQKERLKGINEQYSSLKVDPTGLSSLDANLKILGKSMQGAYMELMSKKNSMNPFDFMQEKQKLLEQPVIINQAIKTLQQRVKDFNDNRYEVGQATDSRTIDILDTLSKGGGDLKPIYKDGVPYLVGTTLGGKNVDVAISEIANGNNDFKFIKSETVQPFIDGIMKDYTVDEKYYAEGGRIMLRKKLRPGWEKVATARFKEDLKMKGEPGMRGYAALFGTNFDGYNKMLEQGEDIEGFLVDSFLNRVNQEFQPYGQAVQTGQLAPTTTSTTQSERNIAATKAELDKKGNITKDNYEEFLNLVDKFQENYIARVENGILQIADNKTGNIRTSIDLSKPSLAKQKLANLAGVTGYSGPTYDATSLIQKYSK